jgi:hypothetical protein
MTGAAGRSRAALPWLFYSVLLVWVAIPLLLGEFDIRTFVALPLMALVGFAGWYVTMRVARPLRSYCLVLLGSACVLALLLSMQVFTAIALLFLLALTAMGFFWAWYWERTEPQLPA